MRESHAIKTIFYEIPAGVYPCEGRDRNDIIQIANVEILKTDSTLIPDKSIDASLPCIYTS
jgi:hypothetical protein